ncbi:MAG TPA: DNRLRE domain-containing protein [Chitinophagaceae bacterium]|nr:DNRLRE domain-containing protein [Chitinophagaceae bacterium]
MSKNIKILLAPFSALFILSASAQTYSGFSERSILLKSDTNTKSVLISNLLEDRVGDISPIIGAAAWADNNKKLQCRSLLYFNYGILPLYISPDQITEARLILRPVEMNTTEQATGPDSREFIVRRVVEPWEDSMTSWLTQPAWNHGDESIKSIPENKKGKKVWIDVTEIVRNMFLYGNNGFMLSYRDSLESESFLSQWFASARYEDKRLRPELLINYSLPVYSYSSLDIWPIYRGFTPTRSAFGIMQEYPVQQPVLNNPSSPKQDIPQPPPKSPVSNEPQSTPKIPVKTAN